MDGDMLLVFKRLAELGHRFLDERHQEMPLPEKHWGETPLFLRESGSEV
jgi:hypothetical protein